MQHLRTRAHSVAGQGHLGKATRAPQCKGTGLHTLCQAVLHQYFICTPLLYVCMLQLLTSTLQQKAQLLPSMHKAAFNRPRHLKHVRRRIMSSCHVGIDLHSWHCSKPIGTCDADRRVPACTMPMCKRHDSRAASQAVAFKSLLTMHRCKALLCGRTAVNRCSNVCVMSTH